jgi:hypothetical protein
VGLDETNLRIRCRVAARLRQAVERLTLSLVLASRDTLPLLDEHVLRVLGSLLALLVQKYKY